jgi:hypothetical protein
MERLQANEMARALTSGGRSMEQYPRTAQMIRAIGVPAAHQGLMQTGQLIAQMTTPRGLNIRGPSYHLQPGQGPSLGGMETGGRVPKTGTYTLHKNEVVVPKKAADVLFPYSGPDARPKKSYQKGTGTPGFWQDLIDRARKKGGVVPSWRDIPGPLQMDILQTVEQAQAPPLPEDPIGGAFPVDPGPVPGGTYMGAPVPGPPTVTPPPPGSLEITGMGRGVGGPTQFGAPGRLPGLAPGQTVSRMSPAAPPETPEMKISNLETEAARYRESARNQEARARILQTYTDQRGAVPPEVKQMVQSRMQSAAFWMKQADEIEKEKDKLEKAELMRAVKASELAGKVVEAQQDAQEALRESAEKATARKTTLYRDLQKAKTDLLGAEDLDDAQYADLMLSYFAPFLGVLAQGQGTTTEDAAFGLRALLMGERGGDPAAAGAMAREIAKISTAIEAGRFGATK